MITCTTIGGGGLGNQMFKYAALKSLSLKKGYKIKIPDKSSVKLVEFPNVVINKMSSNDYKKIVFTYDQPGFHFDSNFLHIPDNTNLIGHFQSQRYFLDYGEEIRNIFNFDAETEKKASKLLSKLSTPIKKIVSVHVRRGDYIEKSDKHTVLLKDYYNKGMKHFSDNFHFLFFSDDIPWCKRTFKGENISYSDTENDLVDLCAMSKCAHNIVANSSFSWWGAWLNTHKKKIVIAPEIWFGPSFKHLNTKDLIPNTWLTI